MVNRREVTAGSDAKHATENDVTRKVTLEQARLRKLWSANRLANASGVAVTTILDIEHGDVSKPQLGTIEKLCRALECEPTDIMWPGNPLGAMDEE